MIKFRLLFILISMLALLFFSACSSTSKDETKEIKVCPQCHMELPASNMYTSILDKESNIYYFDDIGCMILYANDDKLPKNSKVFTNDTHRYIESQKAFYTINEKTPMSYGFAAYEKTQENTITFDEVVIKMLRGEHMANPKIRKQILGY